MATYNGHKNWNCWNVSLWINNDEGLYYLAKQCLRRCRTKRAAAEQMLEILNGDCSKSFCGGRLPITCTPDGAPYSVGSILAAMRGL